MGKVTYFKMPFQTNLFDKNQKVWIVYKTGDLAVNVYGRYRGKWRYVNGWVTYRNKEKLELMQKTEWKTISVDDKFENRIRNSLNKSLCY